MCGIVGYVGEKPCTEIIIDGLKKLEYRGYDSAGIAVLQGGDITMRLIGREAQRGMERANYKLHFPQLSPIHISLALRIQVCLHGMKNTKGFACQSFVH